MGKGLAFWEQQRRWVKCPECGVEVVTRSLFTYDQIQNSVSRGDQGGGNPPRPNLPGIFTKTSVAAPVPGIGVPGWNFKPDQPLGLLCAPPCAEHNCDPGGG